MAEFKVGDRVRVLVDDWAPDVPTNSTGVVAEILKNRTPHAFTVKIDGGDGFAWFYSSDELSLIPHYAAGDRIQLSRPHSGYSPGHKGTVTISNDDNVGVLMDIGRYASFPHDVVERERESGEQHATSTRVPWGSKPKPKFKAGDRVRSKRQKGDGYTIACVKTEYSTGIPYDGALAYEYADNAGWDLESSIELFPDTPCPQDNEQQKEYGNFATGSVSVCGEKPKDWLVFQPAIVALAKTGQIFPSERPYLHPNAEAATKEAERLARKHPGQEFAVYQRVTARVAEVQMKEVA